MPRSASHWRCPYSPISRASAAAERGDIDVLVNAQQARRALDYLVGFNLSPVLWRKVQRGLSAGRVQSPALRMIVEREEEIEAFVAREYWSIEADCAHPDLRFGARLLKKMLGNIEAYLACCQLGITMASLGIGFLGEVALASLLEDWFGNVISHAIAAPLRRGSAAAPAAADALTPPK